MRLLSLTFAILCASSGFAQASFDVATIKLSSGEVRFEHDGEITLTHATLQMHDVTLLTCIKWAYHVQRAQIEAPDGMDHQHYDIVAKADGEPTMDQMRIMLRELLAERFALKLRPGIKEVNAYAVTMAPHGLKKLKPAVTADGEPWHQNSAMGMIAKSFTMQDFVTYMSDPLGTPLVDETNLPGRYDFELDFRPYVDEAQGIHADPQAVLKATFEGELGLRLVRGHRTISTLAVEHVASPTPD